MGFLSAYSGVQRIDVGGGYWIEVRECLPIMEKQRAEKALASAPRLDMTGNGSVAFDHVAFANEMMTSSIVDWNLDDDNGQIWPLAPDSVKRQNIARLPAPVFDQVWDVVNRLNGPRETAEQVRFPEPGVGGDQVGNGGAAVVEDVRAGAAALAAAGSSSDGSGVAPLA